MRICMIFEGCYPYVRGGVSGWADHYIRSLPQHDFVLWLIGAEREKRGRFLYELPPNVVDVKEVFLDEAFLPRARVPKKSAPVRETREELARLFRSEEFSGDALFGSMGKTAALDFLDSEFFLELLKESPRSAYAAFSDYYHTVRSVYTPLFYLLGQKAPEAELYHAVSTGYGGILGVMGARAHNRPFVLTEHGIYTREREEEILRSNWVQPCFKDMWIRFFHMLSRCAYARANVVTSLFSRAMETQIELGCPAEKCRVIGNGIFLDRFLSVPPKRDNGFIDIGAVVRIAPIKDIKTMIYAFHQLKAEIQNARLHVLGDTDDEQYYTECLSLVEQLGVKDIFFVGNTDVKAYMERLDFTVLSSISEAQPLAVIESMAAGRPCVVTDVGACREMVEGGETDDLGGAGICVPPMYSAEMANAMARLSASETLRARMGAVGQARAGRRFDHAQMLKSYQDAYERAERAWRESASS